MCRIGGLAFGCALILLALSSSAARGEVIFDNGAPDFMDGWASDFVQPVQEAEDFVLAAGQNTITGVHWWGSYSYSTIPSVDDFTVQLFADNGGFPAVDPFVQLAVGDVGRTDTGDVGLGGQIVGHTIFKYSVDISPVTLVPSTRYYLSIVNSTPGPVGESWRWTTSVEGAPVGSHWWRVPGVIPWTAAADSLAFNLTGIPEPATLSLLTLGGLLITRRRR